MLGITHAQASSRRGFTLIEMSIVLVIIGLIIGGILKGQEIIESSRQKNVITQMDSVKAAVNTFADKYNSLPGDYALPESRILSGLTSGNGGGTIGATYSTAAGMAAEDGLDGEHSQFFNHLAAADLLGGSTVGGATDRFGDGAMLPATAIPGTGMTVVYGLHEFGPSDRRTHWVRIHRIGAADNTAPQGGFSPKQMFEVDLKIDDGRALTGVMRSMENAGNCNTTDTYLATDLTQTCSPYLELVR